MVEVLDKPPLPPTPIQFDVVLPALKDLIEAVMETVEGWSADARIEPIETEHYAGFIPWTSGGWVGRASSGLYGSQGGGYLPNCLQDIADSDYRTMCEDYCAARYPDRDLIAGAAEAQFSVDIDSYPSDGYTAAERWRDGWESEDSYFFYDARAILYAVDNPLNETGEDEVYLFTAVNTDLNYGRDSVSYAGGNQHRGEWSRTLKLSEVTEASLMQARLDMIVALAEA